jgi:hypothetical protein
MKAHRNEVPKPFEPVTLILESQNEVDACMALFNSGSVCEAVGLERNVYQTLLPYRSHKEETAKFNALCKILK